MKIIGLTGGIASGKNFVADIFAKNGAAVFDADKEVHNLLESDKLTIDEVKKNFPTSFVKQKIDRKILGKIVFFDAEKLKILEEIIHPKVRKNYQLFLKNFKIQNKKIAVLNIPLLLETKGYECDKVLAITVSPSIQKKRFLSRSMKFSKESKQSLEKKFSQILAKQMTNKQRKSRADFVIDTNCSKSAVVKKVKEFLDTVS
jgi:dephospho-CoA kinase